MKISLAVLITTLNDEEVLADCVESARHIADEIVIVDRGSTDNTLSVAQACGVKLIETQCTNDLAASADTTFRQITSDWVLWLRADEQLSQCTVDSIQPLLRADNVDAYYVLVRETASDAPSEWYEHEALRLFRNKHTYKFSGIWEEQITPSIRDQIPSQRMDTFPFTITRTVLHEKARERAIQCKPVLEQAVREQPDSAELIYALGRIYSQLGRPKHARDCLKQALMLAPDTAYYRPMLTRHLAHVLLTLEEEQEAELLLSLAVKEYSDYTDLYCLLGVARERLGLLDEAMTNYQQALECHPDLRSYVVCTSMSTYLPLTGMASILQKQGRSLEAVQLYSQALHDQPLYEPALQGAASAQFDLHCSESELAAFFAALVPLTTLENRLVVAKVFYDYGAYQQAIDVLAGCDMHSIEGRLLHITCLLHSREFSIAYRHLQFLAVATKDPAVLRAVTYDIAICFWSQGKHIPTELGTSALDICIDALERIDRSLFEADGVPITEGLDDPLLQAGRILIHRCVELGLIALGSQLVCLMPSLDDVWVEGCYENGYLKIAADHVMTRKNISEMTADELCIVAEHLYEGERYEEAVHLLEHCIAKNPKNTKAQIAVVHTYLQLAHKIIHDRRSTVQEHPDLLRDQQQIDVALQKLRGLPWQPAWSPRQRRNLRVTTSDFAVHDCKK